MSNELKSAMKASNLPVDSGHFDIEINVLDDDGKSVKKLSEFGSTIVSWSFEAAPPPPDLGPEADDSDLHFDDPSDDQGPETDAHGRVTRPVLSSEELADDDEDDDGDDDDSDDDEDRGELVDDYRELVLTHQITGASFREINKWIFGQNPRPSTSVKISYYVEITDPEVKDAVPEKHYIFTHTFYGLFYSPEDISGNRQIGGQKQGPLLLVTKMEVLGSDCYGDPADAETLGRIMQEYAAGTH